MAKILYLGDLSHGSTSLQRAEALRRLGHHIVALSSEEFYPPQGRIHGKVNFLTGHAFQQAAIVNRLERMIGEGKYDVGWVDAGWWCGPPVAKLLAAHVEKLVLLNLDDPTGPREPSHWRSLLQALPLFNLCAVVRWETAHEFHQLGAQRVVRIWRSYDEIAHAPERAATVAAAEFRSEVSFIGTRMEDRHEFMVRLVERGVPLSIWGDRWKNCPGWKTLKNSYRGPAVVGAEYVAAMQRSKICLGLLSSKNRDLHTTRSSEIPYAGGLFCGMRTSEHRAMFAEGEEAVFWENADECAEVCHELLRDEPLRRRIQAAGSLKIRTLGIGHQQVCQCLLAIVDRGLPSPAVTACAPALAILTSHPIQYQAPLWQALAKAAEVPFEVWFLTNHGVSGSLDQQFGQAFAWDLNLLEGYPSRYLEVNPNWSMRSYRGVQLIESLEHRLRQQQIQALWVEGWRFKAHWQAIRAARRAGVKVWMRGESNDLKRESWLKCLLKRPLLCRFFQEVDRFLAIGSANRRLYEGYGMAPEKITPTPYCVDNDRFAAAAKEFAPRRAELRQKWNIPENAYCVLFCGKFISKKRPLDLVAAAQQLAALHADRPLHLLLVGSGKLGAKLQSLCQVVWGPGAGSAISTDPRPTASFVGFLNQTEIPAAYAAADVLVLPSDFGETWGLVVNEALASGLPAIVSDQCGCAEDLPAKLHPELVFRCGDVADLARAIDFARRTPFSAEQLQAVAETHHLRHTVETVTKLYRELEAAGRTPGR